jgi:hypothetical protein
MEEKMKMDRAANRLRKIRFSKQVCQELNSQFPNSPVELVVGPNGGIRRVLKPWAAGVKVPGLSAPLRSEKVA